MPTTEQHNALSKDWTKVITSCFLQLLNDLNNDISGSRRSVTVPQNGDPLSARLRKLQYFIAFCRLQYDENILNKSDFLREFLKIFKIITDRPNCANQISGLISMASLYLDELKQSRYFLMQLVQYSVQQFIRVICLLMPVKGKLVNLPCFIFPNSSNSNISPKSRYSHTSNICFL